MCRGKIVTLSYMRNEWKTHSYSWSTNTLISYATWVILLHFPSQQDDGSLLLVDYHEIFMASFVCLCKPQKCHNSDPIQPLPSIYLFYLASQSLCSTQAVQFTTSLCEMSPSLSLSWTRAFLPCLLQTEMLTFSSIFTHRSSEIRIFCATNTIYILSRYCFIYTNVYETTQPTLQQMYVFLLRHLLFHFSHQLVTIPYTFRE